MTRSPALEWSTDNCSVARTLEVIGEKWTLVVLRELFQGVRRFEDMRARTGIPRQVLSDRLGHLVADGVLRRESYREPGQRARHEYRLTQKGIDLHPVLVALMAWGDAYAADPEGPSIELHHKDCGAPVALVLQCSDGHGSLTARDVRARPGPAARRRSA
ncbi:MAG TPA: helix-turn-helix domain-containing protein [Actinomycetes bacterium]|jgi:DNA-binding HxlR family transcriptional regulator